MSQQVNLPFRLGPGKGMAVFGTLFMICWLVGLVVMATYAVPMVFEGDTNPMVEPVTWAFILIPALMFISGLGMLAFFAGRLLPGTPLDHLELSEAGVRKRFFWKVQDAAWSQVGQFGSILRVRKSKEGTKSYWLVIGEPLHAQPASDDDRERRALVSFDAASYTSQFDDKQDGAAQLAKWLNDMLEAARDAKLAGTVLVPDQFDTHVRRPAAKSVGRSTIERTQQKSVEQRSSRSNRKSVIER